MKKSPPQEKLEDDKKKYYDPKPLRYYRPPLKSDLRSICKKTCVLSLQSNHQTLPTSPTSTQDHSRIRICSVGDSGGKSTKFETLQKVYRSNSLPISISTINGRARNTIANQNSGHKGQPHDDSDSGYDSPLKLSQKFLSVAPSCHCHCICDRERVPMSSLVETREVKHMKAPNMCKLSDDQSCSDPQRERDEPFDLSSKSSVERPVVSLSNFRVKDSKRLQNPESSQVNGSESAMAAMGLPTSFGCKRKRKPTASCGDDPGLSETLQVFFSKRYQFQFSDENFPSLPDPSLLFTSKPWVLDNFIKLKQDLNAVKKDLNDLPLQDWHAHTGRRHKAGNVVWQVKKQFDPEFVTQAWCKFYEMASCFPLVPQEAIDKKILHSVHLCEAPGAFVSSLNHFLPVHYGNDFKFDWRAVTLNPYYEGNPLSCMINDDRLILKTMDNWLFGQDHTGDLMSKENLFNILEEASHLGEILLVTADGSIDCQENPEEQENMVSWLQFCETVAALKLLAPGGNFLIKMFTFYEHSSICLMYLLVGMFESVTVTKPATSKEGNSEVYVVCCDYYGARNLQPWLDGMIENYGSAAPKTALFPLECISTDFLDQLYRCAYFFFKLQTDVIKENLRSFHQPARRDSNRIARIRHSVAARFFDRCKIEKLDRKFYLSEKHDLNHTETPNIDPRSENRSYNDRTTCLSLSPIEELAYINDQLHLNSKLPGDNNIIWMHFPSHPNGFKIVLGKPITKINSSKFCLGSLLKLQNRARDIAQDHFKDQLLQKTHLSDIRKFEWPDEAGDRKVTTLDFTTRLWASLEGGSNADYEKTACNEILLAVKNEVFKNDCLELRGYPLLTQFNVGVIFLLGHLFEKVGFVRPVGQDSRILFYNYKSENPKVNSLFTKIRAALNFQRKAVLSVVSITELSDGDFYRYVTEINHICVLAQIRDLLNAVALKQKDNDFCPEKPIHYLMH